MSISYSDFRTKVESPAVLALLLVNAGLMLCVVLAWPFYATTLAEPIEWALSTVGNQRLDLLAYPYLTLWGLPLACCVISSYANRIGMTAFARLAGLTPPLLLSVIFGWYWLAPQSWH